jgi:hypothetical protein
MQTLNGLRENPKTHGSSCRFSVTSRISRANGIINITPPHEIDHRLPARLHLLLPHFAPEQASSFLFWTTGTMFLSLLFTPWTLLALPLLFFILPYMRNWSIQDVPGPFLAKFSNLWLLIECRLCRRYLTVHEAHAKYGKLVRIQPNQVSIADPDAIPIVYGHGTGFLKAYEFLVKYVNHKLTI